MVIDTSTPSCGNSRFGCWVCTVVEQDKSIQGFIENGESWLEPMAEFRNMILQMREDRENHRVKDESRIGGYGPFKPESRQLILKELFQVEKLCKVQATIIRFEELLAIQTIWDRKVVKYFCERYLNEVYGINQKSPVKDFDEELMLVELCKKNDVPYQMIRTCLLTSVICLSIQGAKIFL